MNVLKEVVVPVRFSIGFQGVAEVGDGVLLLANYERVLWTAKCAIIDPELSKVWAVSK